MPTKHRYEIESIEMGKRSDPGGLCHKVGTIQ